MARLSVIDSTGYEGFQDTDTNFIELYNQLPISYAVANEAALGTGDTDGQLRVTADDGNLWSWDDGNSKWRVIAGNHYSTAGLPIAATYTIPTGTVVFDTTLGAPKTWDGSAFVASIEIGHATDTTLARRSAGDINIEGKRVYREDGADVPIADGGTGASTAGTARTALGVGTGDSPRFAGADMSDGNLTSVGDIELDTISNENGTLMLTSETDGDAVFSQNVGVGRSPTQGIDGYVASGGLQILADSDSIGIAGANSVELKAIATGNSSTITASIGVVYFDQNGQAGTNGPAGFLQLEAGDSVSSYLWADNSDNLRISTTVGHVGAGNLGTVVGTQTSDERLKDNIQPISYGLDELMQIEPIEFDRNGVHELGFSAQATAPILPEVVYDTGDYLEPPGMKDPYEIPAEDALELVEVTNHVQKLDNDGKPKTKKIKKLNKKTGQLDEVDTPDTKLETSEEYRMKKGVELREDGTYWLTEREESDGRTKLAMKQIQILAVVVKAIQELEARIAQLEA